MDYRDLVAQSIEELRLKTATHNQLWDLGNADWSVDQDSGQIVFSAPSGMVATCPVQIIGTFNTEDSTWLWAWDHPSVQAPLREHAIRLREYGEANDIQELATRKLSATEEQCWEFTALACKLNEAQGGYRGPAGTTLVFMTFGGPQLSKTPTEQGANSNSVAQESPANFTPDIPEEIRATVTGFIQALHDWEVAADAGCNRDRRSGMTAAKESYEKLIREWCVRDVTPQSISFSSEPHHGVSSERFVSAALSDSKCQVRTQHSNSTGFVTDYEYHLRFEDGRWLVENLFYVDEEGKYEML